jgi:hypothetical protein
LTEFTSEDGGYPGNPAYDRPPRKREKSHVSGSIRQQPE